MNIEIVAFYLSCGHLKVAKAGKLAATQRMSVCGWCDRPGSREIKARTISTIWV